MYIYIYMHNYLHMLFIMSCWMNKWFVQINEKKMTGQQDGYQEKVWAIIYIYHIISYSLFVIQFSQLFSYILKFYASGIWSKFCSFTKQCHIMPYIMPHIMPHHSILTVNLEINLLFGLISVQFNFQFSIFVRKT